VQRAISVADVAGAAWCRGGTDDTAGSGADDAACDGTAVL
jgi:hypothetical protein